MTARSEFPLAEIARRLGLDGAELAAIEPHAGHLIRGIAEVAEAGPDQIVFVGSGKYARAVEKSRAFVFVVDKAANKEIPADWRAGRVIVSVADLKVAMAKASAMFGPEEWCSGGVHSTAYVDRSATLGRDVRVGAHATVGPGAVIGDGVTLNAGVFLGRDVRIGAGSVLFPNVVVYDGVEIGARVRIHANTVIGADGFGYAQEKGRAGVEHVKIHHVGIVRIGDDVEIGASTTIDRGTFGDTVIGRGTKIDNQVQIGHNCQIGEGVIICGNTGLSGSCKIGRYAVIAGFCGLANGSEVGEGAVIGAMTGVQGAIPPGTVWAGIPARPKTEHYRIQGALGALPDIYKHWKRSTKADVAPEGES